MVAERDRQTDSCVTVDTMSRAAAAVCEKPSTAIIDTRTNAVVIPTDSIL